jgi:hypothetical protein
LSKLVSTGPIAFARRAAKVVGTPLYSLIYRADRARVERLIRQYRVGAEECADAPPLAAWRRTEAQVPGLRIITVAPEQPLEYRVPFVYERADAEHLRDLRMRVEPVVRGARDEYDAMLQLGAWLGSRWDHGCDQVPGGNLVCNPATVIAAGERGAKFWCEIAARTAVQAATSLAWTARLITASPDGYTWDHAVAEFWSNQFCKWFVLDTDFNVVYERGGVPLSAFELVHEGEGLQSSDRLQVRAISAPKPSLPYQDLMPFYRYIHVDLRNDWCSRPLARGSPSGGDLATWWTARPSLRRLMTAKPRVDDPALFNWQVNTTALYPVMGRRNAEGSLELQVGLAAYSPTFVSFELSVDSGPWRSIQGTTHALSLRAGHHLIQARILTASGYPGPPASLALDWAPQ